MWPTWHSPLGNRVGSGTFIAETLGKHLRLLDMSSKAVPLQGILDLSLMPCVLSCEPKFYAQHWSFSLKKKLTQIRVAHRSHQRTEFFASLLENQKKHLPTTCKIESIFVISASWVLKMHLLNCWGIHTLNC